MRRDRVILTPAQREIACRVVSAALLYHEVEVIALCVSAKHGHALARFHKLGSTLTEDRLARRLMGIAKKRSARELSDAQLADRGGVWGVRCRPMPAKDREHQVTVLHYIRKHASKGAVVWSLHPQDQKRLNLRTDGSPFD